MKLRIKGNSIRLRLLKSEVDQFAAEGSLTDRTAFGANSLRYSIRVSADAEKIFAEFQDNEIRVVIPDKLAREWVANGEVGFEADQSVGDEILTILVEKDFACLDRPDDPDRHDAFPNPKITC